jgi:hypothetical protein
MHTHLSLASSSRCRCSTLLVPSNADRDDTSLARSRSDRCVSIDFLYVATLSSNTLRVAGSWLRTSTSICLIKSPAWLSKPSTKRTNPLALSASVDAQLFSSALFFEISCESDENSWSYASKMDIANRPDCSIFPKKDGRSESRERREFGCELR